MKKFSQLTFTDKIRRRITALYVLLILMLVYMVFVGETGGDSRMMTRLAHTVSRILFFGGLACVVHRIIYNRKLLKNRLLLKEQMLREQDERNQYLHDKSGGLAMDILLLLLLFVTTTAAFYNMPAFYVSLAILTAAVLLKCTFYFLYNR